MPAPRQPSVVTRAVYIEVAKAEYERRKGHGYKRRAGGIWRYFVQVSP